MALPRGSRGFVQGNLAILPCDWADEFLRFCVANPKPCLLIGIAEPVHGCPLLGGDRKAPNSRRSEAGSWLRGSRAKSASRRFAMRPHYRFKTNSSPTALRSVDAQSVCQTSEIISYFPWIEATAAVQPLHPHSSGTIVKQYLKVSFCETTYCVKVFRIVIVYVCRHTHVFWGNLGNAQRMA